MISKNLHFYAISTILQFVFILYYSKKNIPKPKINWLFFVLTFLYVLFEAVVYFYILFGLPVTLAIHIIIRYRVHEKWICFWSKYSCLPSGIQTIFGKIVGIWMMWTFVLERIFQIHFVFYVVVFQSVGKAYVNNSVTLFR